MHSFVGVSPVNVIGQLDYYGFCHETIMTEYNDLSEFIERATQTVSSNAWSYSKPVLLETRPPFRPHRLVPREVSSGHSVGAEVRRSGKPQIIVLFAYGGPVSNPVHRSSIGCDSRSLEAPRRARFDPFSPSVGSGRVGALKEGPPGDASFTFTVTRGRRSPTKIERWVDERTVREDPDAVSVKLDLCRLARTGERTGHLRRCFAPNKTHCAQRTCDRSNPGPTCVRISATFAPFGIWRTARPGSVSDGPFCVNCHCKERDGGRGPKMLRLWGDRNKRAA
jgi:hypothetical protein